MSCTGTDNSPAIAGIVGRYMSIANGDKAKISAREIISLSGGIAGVIDIPYLAFQKDNS
jgi:hypothetical protein